MVTAHGMMLWAVVLVSVTEPWKPVPQSWVIFQSTATSAGVVALAGSVSPIVVAAIAAIAAIAMAATKVVRFRFMGGVLSGGVDMKGDKLLSFFLSLTGNTLLLRER
jgi:hypothetical protein